MLQTYPALNFKVRTDVLHWIMGNILILLVSAALKKCYMHLNANIGNKMAESQDISSSKHHHHTSSSSVYWISPRYSTFTYSGFVELSLRLIQIKLLFISSQDEHTFFFFNTGLFSEFWL